MAIQGTNGDDDLTGTTGNDVFLLRQGGEDTASGGDGNDVFRMGAHLDAGDRIDGGTGQDTVRLDGGYYAGVVFTDDTITNIEALRLGAGFNYRLTLADGNVAAGERLSVNAADLDAGKALTFDGAAETDGHFLIYGGAGDDVLTGGAQSDVFSLTRGGDDTVHGGGGNDTFRFGIQFTRTDAIDGGAGSDTLVLTGDLRHVLAPVFDHDAVTGIEKIELAGSDFSQVSFDGDLTGSGGVLTVDAREAVVGTYVFAGPPAAYRVVAGAGIDHFKFNTAFLGTNSIDGGAGSNTLELNAGTTAVFDNDTIRNIDTIEVDTGRAALTLADGNVAAGRTLTIAVTASQTQLTIDGSAESDGAFIMKGSLAADILTGGAGDDNLRGGQGADLLTGGGGADIFGYGDHVQSYSGFRDHIADFTAGTDKIDMDFAVLGVGNIEYHTVNQSGFDSYITAAGQGDDTLHPHWAHIVHADGGDLAGHDFLVVDAGGDAQYSANTDYVMDITGYAGTLTVGDFI